MFEVNIYLETSLKGPGTREGWYEAVLEYIDRKHHAVTREDYVWEKETTYHKSTLCALAKALKRLNASCFVNIYMDSAFVKNSIETNLDRWKENGFVNVKGEPVKNQEEWREVARLLAGHKLKFRMTKRNPYSGWMQTEAKKRFSDKMAENAQNTECEGV